MADSDTDIKSGDERRTTTRELVYSWFILGIVILCIVLIIAHPFVKIQGKNMTTLDVNGNIGWIYTDGSKADLTHLKFEDGKGIVSREITSVFSSGKDLCFETSNLFFKVYLDDEEIYDFHPEIKFYYGQYYGDYIHLINIPYFKDTGHLRIEYEALTINSWTCFRNVQMSEGSVYFRDGVGNGIFQFALCFSTLIIGIIIIIMGCVFHSRKNGMIETVSLGAVAILMACYLMSGTKIWQLLFMDSAMPRIVEYTTLTLIPVPLILFVAAFTDRLQRKLPLVICCSSFTLLLIMVFSIITGLFDFSILLGAIHANIVISMSLLVIYFFISLRQVEKVTGNKWLLIAFVVLITTGVIDIALYYIQQQDYQIRVVNFGLGFFIIVLALYEIGNIMEINRINSEADTMYRLARLDGLTGLANRLAFDEAEKDLASEAGSSASIALLDINFLKTVNDKFGHSEGDRHIKNAARIINESFGLYGKCYRIGGDEFVAIIRGSGHGSNMNAAKEKMTELTNEYNQGQNPPIPLYIACGVASYEYGINTVEEAEKLADSRMYMHKRRIKEDMRDM
ncbi:MAG: diguanylate cyclase [Clostridiales bacterium]|nr:diguanylate cyclase [Clostridiales bacterium]